LAKIRNSRIGISKIYDFEYGLVEHQRAAIPARYLLELRGEIPAVT